MSSSSAGAGDVKGRLVRFFEKYNPEKLSEVDTILTKYQGREVALFNALVGKYGPEPSEPSNSNGSPSSTGAEEGVRTAVGNSDGEISDALKSLLAKSGDELHAAIVDLAKDGHVDLGQLVKVMVPDDKALLSMFQRLYGDYENRIRRIFVRFDVEQLANVEYFLKRAQGQEEKAIVQLLNKYGASAEPRFDAPTVLVKLSSRQKKDNIEEESLFTDEEEEVTEAAPQSMFTAVVEAQNLLADAEKVAAGECSGDDEHTYPKDDEAWVRLRFELSEIDASQAEELRSQSSFATNADPSPDSGSPIGTTSRSAGGRQVTVCVGHVMDSYGQDKGGLCLPCSERVSKAFDCLWTPVGPRHRQAVLSSFVKEGYLDKLDRGGKWARRFFKAKDSGLHYFDSDKETEKPKPKGFKFFTPQSKVIEHVSSEEHKIKNIDHGKFFYFGVTVGQTNEPYFLRTNSEAERQAWVTFIKEALIRLGTAGACRDPNPGRWRARLDGLKKSSEIMSQEASNTANALFELSRRLEEEKSVLAKEEEEVSLFRTQANEMSEQELALQRLVEAGYSRLEEHRRVIEDRKIAAQQLCASISQQRKKLTEDLFATQQEVEALKASIATLHKQIIELEAEEESEEARCRKVLALYRRCEEKARGAKVPSKVFTVRS